MKKYFLSQDQDCHWYIVPVENKKEWDKWCNMDQDNPNAWEVPDYADQLDGGPEDVEFYLEDE